MSVVLYFQEFGPSEDGSCAGGVARSAEVPSAPTVVALDARLSHREQVRVLLELLEDTELAEAVPLN